MKCFFINFLVFLCSVTFLNAQTSNLADDFEGNGTINTWYGDDCNINTALNNPFSQGDNTSNTVLEYHDVGGQYANVGFNVANNFDLTTYNTFSLKIYIPSNGLTGNQNVQVSLKLQDGNLDAAWSTQSEIIKSVSLDQWQTISFNFDQDNFINLDPTSLPPIERTDFNRVVIQVNGENNSDQVLAYIDDFSHSFTTDSDPIYDNLVWSDEFEGTGAINTDKWFHQTLLPNGESWYNGEIQHYTDRINNSYVGNGTLKIDAIKETFTDQGQTKQYTSARLNSKFAFQYGRVEVRAKMPFGVGTWPAIWTLGKNIDEDGGYWDNQGFDTTPWPACGEMDIMEHWGNNQNYISSATHTPSSFGGTVNVGGQVIPTASTAFHTYTMIWSPEKLVFSVDDVVHFTYNPEIKDANTWPFDAEQYILLNVAILPEIFPGFTSSAMEIDYVRIYQESAVSVLNVQEDLVTQVFPSPFQDQLNIDLDPVPNQAVFLKIFGIEGKLINAFPAEIVNNRISINNLGGLGRGVYFIHFEVDDQFQAVKVIKH